MIRILFTFILLPALLMQAFLASADMHEVFQNEQPHKSIVCDHTLLEVEARYVQAGEADCEHCQHIHAHQCMLILSACNPFNFSAPNARVFPITNVSLRLFSRLVHFRPPILA